MKQLCTAYTFTPGGTGVGTVVLTGLNVTLEQVLLITNVTDNVIIYQFNDSAKGGTRTFGSGNTTITLTYATTGMDAGDRLQIWYDDSNPATIPILRYRNTALSSTKQAVKAGPGDIWGWNFINENTVDVYVKIYNALVGDVIVGTTTPLLTILVPAASSSSNGMFYQDMQSQPQARCDVGITIACVTGLADSSTAAPSTAIHAGMRYQ